MWVHTIAGWSYVWVAGVHTGRWIHFGVMQPKTRGYQRLPITPDRFPHPAGTPSQVPGFLSWENKFLLFIPPNSWSFIMGGLGKDRGPPWNMGMVYITGQTRTELRTKVWLANIDSSCFPRKAIWRKCNEMRASKQQVCLHFFTLGVEANIYQAPSNRPFLIGNLNTFTVHHFLPIVTFLLEGGGRL